MEFGNLTNKEGVIVKKNLLPLMVIVCCFAKEVRVRASEKPSVEHVFTNIYEKGLWWTGETNSGCGSSLYNTQLIRQEIPRIIKQYGVESLLDIPCGDFNWMKFVDLGIDYIGADIVGSLINENKRMHQGEKRTFVQLNIITDWLPKADLILCRDCLVHLSIAQIWQTLRNIKRSGCKYLLTTCYSETQTNSDISAGSWRTINLTKEPFNFPMPLLSVNEGYEGDKCLMMWKIEDLPC
ncbi:MAG TPA: class I SAM-dependent methyltransferase [Candidatus Babeliales bacterium]|nr:class I SAM-dependent methyltransferase [Candidatus Babeliales bacterium]